MKYNAPPGSQDPNASYTNGIPGKIKGSPVNALAIELPQREIVNVIEAAGLEPSNDTLDQLVLAIQKLIVKALPKATVNYELGEFYYFRHPTLKPGFAPAQGGLLANAATLYPEAWAYLQTSEGQKLCKTEAEWQAMTRAIFHTLADGTQIGWNGIGGAPFYAVHMDTGALRMPDLRGMYMEAAGYDALGVGGVHIDGIRPIEGSFLTDLAGFQATGAFYAVATTLGTQHTTDQTGIRCIFKASRMVPTAPKNQPRAWGALACVYLGAPK